MSKTAKNPKPQEAKTHAWRGALSPAWAAEGINAAYRNALRLFDDAQKLFRSGSFPSAAALAVLAIEEYGKPSIIHRILLAKTDKARRDHWREYTSHTAKNTPWVVPNLIKGGAKTLDDFKMLFDRSSVHTFMLDDFKQWGFYTECRGVMWSEPVKTITAEMCQEILGYAEGLVRTIRFYTAEQMECYVKHLSSVWRERAEDTDTDAMRQAMIDYIKECQERGWISTGVDPSIFFKLTSGQSPDESKQATQGSENS
jgi:AbiV family abortive infection protein